MSGMQIIMVLAALLTGGCIGWAIMASRLARSREQVAGARRELDAATDWSSALQQEKKALQTELEAFKTRAITLEAKKDALDTRLAEQQTELQAAREQLKVEFKNAGNALFEEFSAKFTKQSEQKIGDILNPLRERLGEFQKTVTESFSQQGKEQHTLKAEIARIVDMNAAMREQTENLTKALRGDVKAQGNWGEVILERILEASGLRSGIDYYLQAADMGLKDESGRRQHPDVVVNLPDGKHVIIDSKVSLTAYERYSGEADEVAKAMHLKEFIRSLRSHISGLESKKYQHNEKLQAQDFVLMFTPVEGAYTLAIQQDPELHAHAWDKKIVLVCPATLFATLRTIASLWKIDLQNKNALEIARQSGALYDKFVGFVEDMESIGKQSDNLQKAYEKAMNKLSTGSGNLANRAESLLKLGAKASKRLPEHMRGEESDEETATLLELTRKEA